MLTQNLQDNLELSDDSDIEVHPNVDKRSFIRAKQNQIHAERLHRKQRFESLKHELVINDTLAQRVSTFAILPKLANRRSSDSYPGRYHVSGSHEYGSSEPRGG
jgi:cell division cycle protein 37